MSNVPYFSFFFFFFLCLLLDFLVLIFPSSFWGLVSNIFFLSNLLLVFNIWRFSFLRSSWLGCCIFFSCLWSWVLFFPLFPSSAGVALLLYLSIYLPIYIWIVLFWKLSSLLSVVFFFGRGSTVVSFFFFGNTHTHTKMSLRAWGIFLFVWHVSPHTFSLS